MSVEPKMYTQEELDRAVEKAVEKAVKEERHNSKKRCATLRKLCDQLVMFCTRTVERHMMKIVNSRSCRSSAFTFLVQ